MTRATWAHFVRWLGSNERAAGNSDDWARLEVAARLVKTRGEAVAAVLAGTSCMPRGVGEKIERWLDVIRLHGISPPAEPPSAVEELERMASNFEAAANVETAADVSDYFRAFGAGEASGYRDAASIIRDRARQLKEQA